MVKMIYNRLGLFETLYFVNDINLKHMARHRPTGIWYALGKNMADVGYIYNKALTKRG